ncbi:hypothetical protein A5886_002292 [Enterococcus sp. 8G7_MSG3316]|uniref:Uncharacterized protein n=1 Tax=Candidatus Enterococcus testudinis TaxID=1834191 RepID=A0A242A833_9ENTE|nr:hypothetical protein [Enterococcus sp. 8G7_MSG3316]OTN77195.1 hypothetical protein A5886_002292 [Enterococcus sp. 8G7_MSG3316]
MEKSTQLMYPSGLYFVLEDNQTVLTDLEHLVTQQHAALIKNHWSAVPFLSLKDNLALAAKKETVIEDILPFLNLEPSISKKERTALTQLEELQIQLLQALLLEKETLVLEHVLSNLSTSDIQLLLPLCQGLAKHFGLQIFLIHEDKRFAHTPYMKTL